MSRNTRVSKADKALEVGCIVVAGVVCGAVWMWSMVGLIVMAVK